ncbi:MAG: tRNA (adenosine(37)-N6)-threonylcarbamoyltransferase complex dimerization subunit type 1 TsaB [Vicinamibacterales bacterium]
MWVLALDTTTRDGGVALVRDGAVAAVRAGEAGLSHAERIPSDVRAVLGDAGLDLGAVDVIAVATGPGGFTGLRIGIAAAHGLAAALGRPALGVPALTALAWDLLDRMPDQRVAGAWLDASRGEVFAAACARPRPPAPSWPPHEVAPPTAASPDVTAAAWAATVPAGTPVAVVGPEALLDRVCAAGLRAAPPAASLAAVVGRIAWHVSQRGPIDAATLAPVYVRRPDAEIERDRRAAAERP